MVIPTQKRIIVRIAHGIVVLWWQMRTRPRFVKMGIMLVGEQVEEGDISLQSPA
jgi:hypothetical protein